MSSDLSASTRDRLRIVGPVIRDERTASEGPAKNVDEAWPLRWAGLAGFVASLFWIVGDMLILGDALLGEVVQWPTSLPVRTWLRGAGIGLGVLVLYGLSSWITSRSRADATRSAT